VAACGLSERAITDGRPSACRHPARTVAERQLSPRRIPPVGPGRLHAATCHQPGRPRQSDARQPGRPRSGAGQPARVDVRPSDRHHAVRRRRIVGSCRSAVCRLRSVTVPGFDLVCAGGHPDGPVHQHDSPGRRRTPKDGRLGCVGLTPMGVLFGRPHTAGYIPERPRGGPSSGCNDQSRDALSESGPGQAEIQPPISPAEIRVPSTNPSLQEGRQ
jgi:hypothetical protein